ncbi:MAG: amidohydrolase family protein, partial [Deltaproteobacteria bacterium]|nr:amidohydrolase family protein [Deltaproteobacteria bacterium]
MRLISARWVIPITGPPITEGAVIIDEQGGTIVALGTRADMRRAYTSLTETRAEGALCPALVNAHAHLELSAVPAPIAGGDGVVNWTRRLISSLAAQQDAAGLSASAESAESASAAYAASAVAAVESARSFGTVAIADVGNGTTGWVALGRANMEGVFFHELVGSREARTGDALLDAAQERASVPMRDQPRGVVAVPAPHAPYSVGPDLMKRIFEAAARAGHPTTIHLAEDNDEILLLRDGLGAWPAVLRALGVDPADRTPRLSPTAYLERLGAFAGGPPPLLVHMVHTDADDRRRVRTAGSTVVLCARSNVHIGGRLPDVPAFIADGIRLAVGTDSLASVPNLSLWQELSTLASHFPDVSPRTWLHAAT